MFQEILEKNTHGLSSQETTRSYDREIREAVAILNKKSILIVRWLKHVGLRDFVRYFLKKTKRQDEYFYFDKKLDEFQSIKTRENITTLFDVHVRTSWVPRIIILKDIEKIIGIKSFISDLYKTKKYKIIILGNILQIDWAPEIQIFPLWINTQDLEWSLYGGISHIRNMSEKTSKDFVLKNVNNDIFFSQGIENYNIKNTQAFIALIHYLWSMRQCSSLREIYRNLNLMGIEVSLLTMIDYINIALNMRFLEKCSLYDMKKNNTLESKTLYYFWDTGLRRNFDSDDFSLMKNSLYLELRMHWYEVTGWINGRFTFDFRAIKWEGIFSLHMCNSQDKWEIRKIARKLEKIWDSSQKFVIVQNKNSLWMRKFVEWSVRIVELSEFLREI